MYVFGHKYKNIITTMNICRTCLKTPANKDMLQLEKAVNEHTKNYIDIMLFCLDITVTEDSKITTNLCDNCYRKIISFFEFKTLSLKNDVYLKSLQPGVILEDTKVTVYVDENGIKHENLLEPDDYGPALIDNCYRNIKREHNIECEATEAIDSDIDLYSLKELKESEDTEIERKENAVQKKRNHSKKRKLSKAEEVKQKRSVCEKCGKSVLKLKRHYLVHQQCQRKTLQCDLCTKLFSRKSSLTRHLANKHLDLKKECDICHKKVSELSSHKRRMHHPGALPFGCTLCSRRCSSRSELSKHVISHSTIFPYECDYCHKKFATKEQISHHIASVHERVRKHQCHLCFKAYYDKRYLEVHLRTHTNERPFMCAACGRRFISKDCLSKHRHIHSDETFPCQLCDKVFGRRVNLKTHMLTHTKEKRYECRVCGARFARSTHRSRHELSAHKKHK